MTITQTISVKASPARVFEVLTSAKEFGSMTGAPAEIADSEGGKFSCFGGQITGQQIELRAADRIVQAWRAGPWDEGVYSLVTINIDGSGSSSTIGLSQCGFPEGMAEHLEGGWHKMYWDPLKAYLE